MEEGNKREREKTKCEEKMFSENIEVEKKYYDESGKDGETSLQSIDFP
jgi:hypothetical protein